MKFTDYRTFKTAIGGKLLEEVIRLMQLDGYEKFYLWAIDGNEIADGFYRKHGFLRTDDAVDYKIGGEPVRDVRITQRVIQPVSAFADTCPWQSAPSAVPPLPSRTTRQAC